MQQQVFYDFSAFEIFKNRKPFLVCDNAFDILGIKLPCEYIRFSEFSSNPNYEDVRVGVNILRKKKCDCIIAIGGGSSIDTAKVVKYYNHVDLPIMAVPTTSGTGSESTHFAVIYKNGEKCSVADERLLPDYVVLQSDALKTLPLYQKKCTMLDALCQAIESWWSKKATPKSIEYSRKAIKMILDNIDSYLKNEDIGNKNMLLASNLAGKAINITTTTAPHAMSYKLTSLYGLPHGHAVALCLPKVWAYMGGFEEIASVIGKNTSEEAISFLEGLIKDLGISTPKNASVDDLEVLTNSVNAQRLYNNPVQIDRDAIQALYKEVLEV